MQKGAVRKGRAFCFMCAGHNTRSGVKLSNGPVRRTQIAELTISPPLLRPRTDARLSDNSNITQPFLQPLHNRFPTPHQPSGTSTRPQPTFNRHATASQSQLCLNRFPITIQPPEAARRTIPRLANTHDSTTLRDESKNDFDTTILNLRFPKPDNNQTTSQPQPAKLNRRSGVCSFMHHLYDSFKSYFVASFRKTERNQSINITQKTISDPALTVPLIHLFKFSHLKLA